MARSIEKEVELLLKRQSKEMEKTPENELSLVERLEEELKKKKEEAKKALKEKEEATAKKLGMAVLKKYDVSNLEELELAISSEVVSNETVSFKNIIEPSLVNEISQWIDRLNAWEHSKWDNKIDYNEFYPTANRIFKDLLDSLNHQKNSEGEIQNEGDFGQNIANEATDY